MKAFTFWLLATLLGYGALGGGYHHQLSSNPQKIVVIVDSSFAMKDRWGDIPALLDSLDDKKYSTFSLVTEKRILHGWDDALKWTTLTAYAPRDFSRATEFRPVKEADKVYLITNAGPEELRDVPNWEVVRAVGW